MEQATLTDEYRYCGTRHARIGGPGEVWIVPSASSHPQSLSLRTEVMNHSPTGFQWGYGGSGPSQLALALCLDALQSVRTGEADPEVTRQLALYAYQYVKRTLIATIETNDWTITRAAVLLAIAESSEGEL